MLVLIVWIVWTAASGYAISTVSLYKYDDRMEYTEEPFLGGYPGIRTIDSDIQTLENLTRPSLVKDITNFSSFIPPGRYFFSRVLMSQRWSVCITNSEGKNVSRSSGSSSGSYGSGGGGFTVENASWHRFSFEGVFIIQFQDWNISQSLLQGVEYQGRTSSNLTSFAFEVPERGGFDHIDSIHIHVNVEGTKYTLTIYDSTFTIIFSQDDLEERTNVEYRDLRYSRCYATIETELESADIEISLEREVQDTKMNDYATVAILVMGTGFIIVGSVLFLIRPKQGPL